MMARAVPPGWYPLMQSGALKARAVVRLFDGAPVRLLRRRDGGVHAEGADTGAGRAACEAGGWVFVAYDLAPDEPAPAASLLDGPSSQLTLDGRVGATLGDVGENILDTTHTSVVHQGYLRRAGAQRLVEARIESGDGWVSATYPPGAAPSGWGARLLGAHRYTIRDTFRAPAIAEVAYTDDTAPVFIARFWLTPAAPDETYVAANIAVPGTGMVAALKLAALRLFFLRIFAEDRDILELIARNRAAHGKAPLVFAPQDMLRPGIEAILAGRQPVTSAARMALKV
ncbi:MAG: hypothetical protein RLO80_04170 [Hyphomonas sp.]